jgi:glutamine amidotransferase
MHFIQDHPFTSAIVMSHIRKATRGAPAMKNCQPFQRELGGRLHVFAHNGDLDLGALHARMRLESFHPVGETDSEYAFCALLERLRGPWLRGAVPPLEERREIVARFAAEIRALGPANFIYSDGDAVFVHGHKRFHEDGRPPHPPGLHVLCRRCAGRADVHTEGLSVALMPEQEVVLAASVPLTGEPGWRALAEGELVVARRGCILAEAPAALLASPGPTGRKTGAPRA